MDKGLSFETLEILNGTEGRDIPGNRVLVFH